MKERNSCACDNQIGEIKNVSIEEIENDRQEYYKIVSEISHKW